MELTLTVDREEDGRWIAEVPELPGVMVYGPTKAEAMAKAEVLALRVLAERIEHGEATPIPVSIVIPAAAYGHRSALARSCRRCSGSAGSSSVRRVRIGRCLARVGPTTRFHFGRAKKSALACSSESPSTQA